jgi:methanogenic corrinoid protein MtbC1
MAAMTTYVVRAKRWAHGWELHIDGIGVTQSRILDGAEQMVRDYIETLTDRDVSDSAIVINFDPDGPSFGQQQVLAEWQEDHGAFTPEELAAARAEIAAADLEYF